MKNLIISLVILFGIAGCATKPSEIPESYVSPLQYQPYDCNMLTQEMASLSTRVAQTKASLKKKSDGDSTAMGIGMILFWPALFALDGDGVEAQEYSRIKGEYRAVEKAMIMKKCDMTLHEKIDFDDKKKKDLETKMESESL